MECNKDEATRAKEIAEKKLFAKDIAGAKKFALKAQNLYPGLEGIPQMLATLDVYVAAENKINGEADCLLGADGAFKCISEAWSLLSDKPKRVAYDQRRNGKVFQKGTSAAGSSSAKPGSNGSYNFTKSNVKTHKSTPRTGHSSTPASSYKTKPNTFWTVCHGCKMQYEYLRVYLNHKLLCPNCHEPFLAIEMPPPPSHASRAGGASTATQPASVVQQAYEKVKREREEAQAATKREEALKRKNHASKKMSNASSSVYSNAAKRRRGMEDVGHGNNGSLFSNQMGVGGGGTANVSGFRQGSSENRVNGIAKPYSTRDVSQSEIQTLLMEKAKTNIQKKINEWKSAKVSESAAKEGAGSEKGIDRRGISLSNP
ncbi:hypothetical protein OIU84_023753 [Salix udensis]|uniref:Zinc beta-ribbon domain-containing protein n=1 Tax=Salix udensis TaxID=889485 RepID=A0AAD6KT44_9ROSI|nr:hypothetical protein OIU84_023753 [Salix udensis]